MIVLRPTPGHATLSPIHCFLFGMRFPLSEFRWPQVLAAITLLPPVCMAAEPPDLIPASTYWLLPQQFEGSSLTLPGERRENRLSGARSLALWPGIEWQTTTLLSRTRYEQMYPVRAQGIGLSSGPQVRVGAAELSLPVSAGHESYSVGNPSIWASSAPKMTVELGPNDRVRLEANFGRRKEAGTNRRKRSATLSWRHRLTDNWSLTTGLRQSHESGGDTPGLTAETYASLDARFRSGWRWSLASSLSDFHYPGGSGLQTARSTSFSLSTRYSLPDGWWISGELKTIQTAYDEDQRSSRNNSAGLKLFRDF